MSRKSVFSDSFVSPLEIDITFNARRTFDSTSERPLSLILRQSVFLVLERLELAGIIVK